MRLISGDFALKDKSHRHLVIDRIKHYQQLTNLEPIADLTLWTESSISVDYQNVKAYINKIESDNTVLLGSYYHNGISSNNVLLDMNSKQPVYYKQHLIPFGEYTPNWFLSFKSLLPKFHMDELITYKNQHQHIIFKDLKLFASICFELLSSKELLQNSKQANIHIHISDLGWFDNHNVASCLLKVARIRAIETAKPIIYSVNQDIPAFIDYKGNILKQQHNQDTYVLNQKVAPQQGTTFYAQYQDRPVLVLLCSLFQAWKKSTKNKHSL
ncbi:nitrilase-related carbon-nitrogen hydrolase [Isorropodon fossajaponicum symbiont]|uniref:nitrilase-related carbon-nitrogen hydrolase n=1 Tax=Isorropodon fossajaponicum symbiont TaxID=883811 RepID=UPI001CED381C|nr:nitrilase-related carbon-nitrogen hydrolase [Isorropodon fossajaponicum symbiont]